MISDNIIYLAILTHGLYEYSDKPYNNEPDEQIIYAKQKRPTAIKKRLFKQANVIIPNDIEYIQKITYTPFGLYNILSPNDKEKIYNHILSLVSDELIIGEALTELVKNEVTFETIETKLTNQQNPEYILEDLKLLMKNRDNICQEYIYDKSIDKRILLNKSFSVISNDDDEDEDEDKNSKKGIYVMRQEGGPLKVGDNILQEVSEINTQELLEIISRYGYNKVIIIDYSCDICTTMFGIKPDDNHIDQLKTQISEGKIGRGGKQKKKTENRKKKTKYTRKLAKKQYLAVPNVK